MDVYPLAWVGLVAFFLLLDDGPLPARPPLRDLARGGLRGLVFGLGTNLVALRFVSAVVTRFAPVPSFVGPIALVVLAAFEGLRLAIAGVAFHWLVRAKVPRVLSFAIAIYAGTFMPSMIPWTVAYARWGEWPLSAVLAVAAFLARKSERRDTDAAAPQRARL